MNAKIEHRWECTGPELVEFVGRQGDRIEQCMACRRLRVLTATAPAAVALPEAAPILSQRHVCREHLAPVNWRGKGCAKCASELAERKARRGGCPA